MSYSLKLTMAWTLVLILVASFTFAEVPKMINYQGRLTDSAGTAMDTTVSMEFAIYDDSTSEVSQWSETQVSVAVTDGFFNVLIGSIEPLDASLFEDSLCYLGISVGNDPEIEPRTRLISVPYSFRVSTVDGATGGTIIGDLNITDRAAVGDTVNDTAQLYVKCDSINRVGIYANSSQNTPAIMAMHDGTGHGISVIKSGAEGKALSLTRLDGGRAIVVHDAPGSNETFVVEASGATGIGLHTPLEMLDVNGTIHSRSGGFKFPDGSIQISAASDCNWLVMDSVLYTNNNWAIARGGADNAALGDSIHTIVNLGVACTTFTYATGDYANHATISGGYGNYALGGGAIGGGHNNRVIGGPGCTIAGGTENTADQQCSTVGGGRKNLAYGDRSTICGGLQDTCYGYGGVITGGYNNYIHTNTDYAAILGGTGHRIEASGSCILGGQNDTISAGSLCMIFGREVFIDTGVDNRVAFFNGRTDGYFGVNRDSHDGGINHPIHIGTDGSNGNGAHLTAGGVWTNGSSREFKDNFVSIDGNMLLSRISNMPIMSWKYKNTNERHVGPVAEDFVQAFDVGAICENDGKRDDKYLAAGDVAGVALAGVQALLEKINQLERRNAELERRLTELENR